METGAQPLSSKMQLPLGGPRGRVSHLVRVGGFLVAELAYIALAAVAMNHPILLPQSADAHMKEVKGGFNTVFILWQMLSLFPANDILGFMYSGEWSFISREDGGGLKPGLTDRVSTLTSGWLDRIKHILTHASSSAFRMCFATAIAAAALSSVAPGAVSVASVVVNVPTSLQIGKLTIRGDTTQDPSVLDVPATQAATQRATIFIQLEQLQKGTFGFKTDPNTIVAWPPQALSAAQLMTTYQSDVIHYQHSCSWHTPVWDMGGGDSSSVLDNGSMWSVADLPNYTWGVYTHYVPTQVAAGIFALYPYQRDSSGALHPGVANVSAFLFLGGNNMPLPGTQTYLGIDLSGLPTLSRPQGFPISNLDLSDQVRANLATVLICDSQFTLEGGQVTVAPGALLHVSPPGANVPLVGNIPSVSAQTILSSSLIDAVQLVDQDVLSPSFVGTIAGTLFLTKVSPPSDFSTPGVPPQSLDVINANMDKFIASAAKAYVDGYAGPGNQPQTMSVDATVQEQRTALQTGRAQLIITCALVALVALLLAVVTPHVPSRVPFALEALMGSTSAPSLTDKYT